MKSFSYVFVIAITLIAGIILIACSFAEPQPEILQGLQGEAGTDANISDDAYSGDWDGSTNVTASRNAIYDKLETFSGGYTEGARAYNSSNQSLPNNSLTTLSLNSERFDTDDMHDNITNNSRLTCNTDGTYMIVGIVCFAENTVGCRKVALWLNGTTYIGVNSITPVDGDHTVGMMTIIYQLVEGDFVQMRAKQDSGDALDSETQNYSPDLMMQRIG